MAGQGLVINYTQCGYSKPRRDEERPAIWELTPMGAPRWPIMIQCVHVFAESVWLLASVAMKRKAH